MYSLPIVNTYSDKGYHISFLSLNRSWNRSGLERWWGDGEGHLFTLPLEPLEVCHVFFCKVLENAGSSEVNDQNHKSLLVGYQHSCYKFLNSIQFKNQSDFPFWCSVRGHSASESSDWGDPNTWCNVVPGGVQVSRSPRKEFEKSERFLFSFFISLEFQAMPSKAFS